MYAKKILIVMLVLGIYLPLGLANAGDLPTTHVKAVGLNSQTPVTLYDEIPFWKETIPQASNGQITADFMPQDVMGLKGFEILRMSKMGVFDFSASDISKLAGDDPVFEGCDLAGLTLSYEQARAACEAWKPIMAEVMEKKYNTKLLAIGGNTQIVYWCRQPISGLSDLAGKKVRVFNKSMIDFIESADGTAVSIAFGEVIPSLQRGVVDCALTGALSGNTASWPEVTTHQYKLTMGWSINYQSVNLKTWNRFSPEVQTFFVDQFEKLENKMWETIAVTEGDADHCNFNDPPCEYGKLANLTKVAVSDADKQRHKDIMENVVLIRWAKRAGKEYAEKWNETVGKVVGLNIPLDKI